MNYNKKYEEVRKNKRWKFLDKMLEYGPDNSKYDRHGNLKDTRGGKEQEVVIKSKRWRQIKHIFNIGGINYLHYMVSQKPTA